MAQRTEARDSRDDFPTPPWATRALCELLLEQSFPLITQSCLEPAAGRGHMARVLREYFSTVTAFDAHDYGQAERLDYLEAKVEPGVVDWVITNPPFRLAERFILRSLFVARIGVAVLVRTVFVESSGRWEMLFSSRPPALFAPFVERVPMVQGRIDREASSATSYAWFVWFHDAIVPIVRWIAPCRSRLELASDYRGRFGPLGLKLDHSSSRDETP